MLYTDKFGTKDGKAQFKPSPWPGLPKQVEAQKAKTSRGSHRVGVLGHYQSLALKRESGRSAQVRNGVSLLRRLHRRAGALQRRLRVQWLCQ
jgi:hypothetical protein